MKSPEEFFSAFKKGLALARKKHPDYAAGAHDAVDVIKCEVEELEHAVEHESEARQRAEAMDVVLTAARLWMGEAG